MYVPSSDIRKLNKIPSLGADSIVIDCEDGVAFNQKGVARDNVSMGVAICKGCPSECVVRVNDVTSGHMTDDVRAVFAGDHTPHSLMLPKCESIEHLNHLDHLVGFYGNLPYPLPLYILIESPSALLSLPSLCLHGVTSLKRITLQAVVFGSDDYIANIGGQRADSGMGVSYARQSLVTAVKSYNLNAIDIVSIDYNDLEMLRDESHEGAIMGYTGKQIIHPNQIKIVHDAFSPSTSSIEWAKGLISAFNEHEGAGKGAFTYRGKMIDKPLLLQAQNIMKMNEILLSHNN
jgi:citrate lyase subunit beta-like protein